MTAAVIVAGGCAHGPPPDETLDRRAGMFSIQPPMFLTGPMAALLTNGGGYSARVTVLPDEPPTRASGQLLIHGSKLLFAPDPDSVATGKHLPRGDFSFIWDVAEGRGFVLSEALQGYAPLSDRPGVTNVALEPRPPDRRRVDGRDCALELGRVERNDGSVALFQVWRAPDATRLPLEISSPTNQFVLRLTKIRPEDPGARLFAPPEGFTKYPFPETLVDELAARQRSRLGRKAY